MRQYLPDTFIAPAHSLSLSLSDDTEIENPRNYIKIQVFRQNVNPQEQKKRDIERE